METINFSADQIRSEFAGCNSLKEIIREVESQLWKKGHVVCGIRVNGMSLSEEDEKTFAAADLSSVRELAIQSQAPALLVQSSIESQIAMIPDLKRVAILASESFREQDLSQAHSQLGSVLDGCRWLTDSLFLVRGLAKDWSNVEFNEEAWHKTESNYSVTLREILGAYEKKDHNLIGDLLEYDLTNALDAWGETLTGIAK